MPIKVQIPTKLLYLKTVFIAYVNKLLKVANITAAFILRGFFLKKIIDSVCPSINHAIKSLLSSTVALSAAFWKCMMKTG